MLYSYVTISKHNLRTLYTSYKRFIVLSFHAHSFQLEGLELGFIDPSNLISQWTIHQARMLAKWVPPMTFRPSSSIVVNMVLKHILNHDIVCFDWNLHDNFQGLSSSMTSFVSFRNKSIVRCKYIILDFIGLVFLILSPDSIESHTPSQGFKQMVRRLRGSYRIFV
jgi:hypothetical protein